MSRRTSPTLVVFTLGPRTDARRHPLLGSPGRSLEHGLRRACIETAFDAGRDAGLSLVACSPEPLPEAPPDARWLPQMDGSFGERFEAAVDEGLRETLAPLVIVGGDVPGLYSDLLQSAVEGLTRDPEAVVVGPAQDGGFYLLATARPLGLVLREVRWCGRDTRSTLLAALARAGRPVVLLPLLRDLDRPQDVEGWLAERRAPRPGSVRFWFDRVRLFLSARRRPLARNARPAPPLAVFGSILGRAPPLLSLS